ALSGGADSTALLWLCAQSGFSTRFTALIVDHGLRPGSDEEAVQAAAVAQALGITAYILKWPGEKPATGIQAAARDARYRLMAEAAAGLGIQALATAHQLDDVVETFLMRLARGSGLDGLAAIPAQTMIHSMPVLRPLLDVPHADLVALLQAHGIAWLEDPSNQSPAFERARLRAAMEQGLAALGLSAGKIGLSVRRLARAREALEADAARFLAQVSVREDDGWRIYLADYLVGMPEIRIRALWRLLPMGELAQVERLDDWILMAQSPATTLGGYEIRRGTDFLQIRPESPRSIAAL
ncbi:MAG: tRNA lysidine(34) synthetase TilS, partial [Aestuariivirgaceae bacterium]|nr:tRNA lysidine(34) synthetase TilS [Aestuariivirgaceae bacterium]